MTTFREVTDQEWTRIVPLLPELAERKKSRGRPPTDARAVFNGLLWVMYTDSPWRDLPPRFPAYTTCHRRFKMWRDSGILTGVADALSDTIGVDLNRMIGLRKYWRPARYRSVVRTTEGSVNVDEETQSRSQDDCP
ncbi:putative transposase of IS4/5 family DUF4096 [Paraburkholderia sp. RAU2J]|uniref:transposase n=1 Tax=Paraburkholderia sp. RAU2J TaxID=1938810 RepID=UPI000EABC0D3|nr:transposase [Paraburkholderia sp. RAU2J]RKT13722.1 putative transposase of IS4/5 family DUF4096 [Paraburkholderia sp. RAU2J]